MTVNPMLVALTEANGIGGNEREVREVFKAYAAPYAEEFVQDGLGSCFAKLTGDAEGPRVLLGAHFDEVGFMVTQITDKGFLKFQTIGGWWPQVVLAQQVTVTTRDGKQFRGVTGSKPPHVLTPEARNKPVDIKEIFVDLGASSKEEVEGWGIRPGDMVTPYIKTERLNDTPFLLAKAWDNRIGVAVAIRVLENLKAAGHPNVVFSGANVQEEVGLRGARTAAHLIAPTISFALDTGTAGDTPGMTPQEADSVLGKGPQVLIYDASMIPHRGLRDFVIDTAEALDIPFQYTAIAGGGTDAGAVHTSRNGVPSVAITVPVRYLHSHTSVIHEDDFENTVKLVTALVSRLDQATVDNILANA